MFLQEFVRGMREVSRRQVDEIFEHGMLCQALRQDPDLSPWEAEGRLSSDSLDQHRHHYSSFGSYSPYISTTAGTYRERGSFERYNQSLFAFDTALQFAVLNEGTDGWIFFGYHMILGRPAGSHAEFAEEVRDVHQHPQWSRFRGEGEIAAAVRIPPRRIEKAIFYRYSEVKEALGEGRTPEGEEHRCKKFVSPETLLAARGVI